MEAIDETLMRLLQRFGYQQFRPGQERIIRDLLAGRDVLAVMPTGYGKSLTYQLAAQLLPGATVVVSPLIALMRDQAEAVEERGVEVGVVSSAQPERLSMEELREVQQGEAKLLYVTPERFDDDQFADQMRRIEVSLLVVDEAHCISEWGHDFRPSYLRLGAVAEQLGRPVLLGLTATATPWVRREVVERLGMHDPDLVVRGVDRPNLFFEVRRVETEEEVPRILRELVLGEAEQYPRDVAERLKLTMRGSGIVYTRTTRGAEETAELLREWGIATEFYHGRRKKSDRSRVQDQFMSGDVRVLAATNAFGLGVDKPDVRFVIHRDVPGSVEAYYQEAGRAGRDGEFARCVAIYRPGALGRAAFLSSSSRLTRQDVELAREGLLMRPGLSLEELTETAGLGEGEATRLVGLLQREGLLEERAGHLRLTAGDFDPGEISLRSEERRKAYEHSRLEMMRGYAEAEDCRRRYLLNYFGEEYEPERCYRCDNDLLEEEEKYIRVAEESNEGPYIFGVGDRVVHRKWGAGTVHRVEGDTITVLFEEAGFRTLSAKAVRRGDLLRRAA